MTERRLLAWIAGALEPGEAEDIAAAASADRSLALHIDRLRERVRDVGEERAWALPPPGVRGGQRSFGVRLEASAFSSGPVRPGEAFRLWLEDPGPPARIVVVLVRGPAGWAVLAPGSPEDVVRLDELPRAGSGGYHLDLVAPDLEGRVRWGVALPPEDLEIHWEHEPEARWAALREAMLDGTTPVSVIELG